MDKVREAILNGDVTGAAKVYMESKKTGHDVEPARVVVPIVELKYSEVRDIASVVDEWVQFEDTDVALRMALEENDRIMVLPDCNFTECDHGARAPRHALFSCSPYKPSPLR